MTKQRETKERHNTDDSGERQRWKSYYWGERSKGYLKQLCC